MRALTDDENEPRFRHPDPVTDQALEWVLRLQAKEEDRAALNAWLAEGADRGAALSRVLALYDCPALTVATAQTAAASEPSNASTHRTPAATRRFGFVPLALAASLAAAIIVPLLGSDWLLRLRADHRTGAGEITTIDLPDGSRMQMNSQTAVILDFDNGRRAVQLLGGEAYFEVAHDATRPFTVTGGFGTVRVTGTAFDVARGADADVVHLDSGRVTLTQDGTTSAPVAMTPGQTASIDRARIAFLAQDDGDSRLAWREGWIELSAVPLRTALDEIGRHTDRTIVTLPGAALDTPVSGSFRIADADAAIDSVATAAGARIERLPGGILFIR
ncbi:transmembrane sensor [Peteryoungia aggregata LMG 23059]|uniref:Transmembrane sensor n=1 Tax=Peteryoungia aggregata LMG 23059 TaxID=1368425 RepID=A0ABU0GAU8_9HYPH|nr:FecR domain-containing protein [Peteryoungia aggregata]MDQ0422478.1 transmembrane sensor [Peteryoungia aggregata LMG 23059]